MYAGTASGNDELLGKKNGNDSLKTWAKSDRKKKVIYRMRFGSKTSETV